MDDIEAIAAKLLNAICALPEEKMRLALLCRTLSSLPPEKSALLLEAIYSRPAQDAQAAQVRSLMVDDDAVHGLVGDAAYNSIYLAALRGGLTRISRLFAGLDAHLEGVGGYEEEEFIKMEHLTLGERRSLSKSPLNTKLDMLLNDPDPVVVGNLLNNPRMTEREVLKIASKRPNSAQVLKLVALNPKWSKRYAVSRALTLNPYTPARVSIALLEKMLGADLSAISGDATLHPELREAAKELFLKRKQTGKRQD